MCRTKSVSPTILVAYMLHSYSGVFLVKLFFSQYNFVICEYASIFD